MQTIKFKYEATRLARYRRIKAVKMLNIENERKALISPVVDILLIISIIVFAVMTS